MKTVKELIEELSKLPEDLPVFVASPGTRQNEYHAIDGALVGHLKDQNCDGDPSYYWCDPKYMDEEEKKERQANGRPLNEVSELILLVTN
jgi:hypothetical protein